MVMEPRTDYKAELKFQYSLCRVVLMVALPTTAREAVLLFQYSLCRVVLMVRWRVIAWQIGRKFQYSLCRVVLMVSGLYVAGSETAQVSVLALSSRFDGHIKETQPPHPRWCFSTRSVESF